MVRFHLILGKEARPGSAVVLELAREQAEAFPILAIFTQARHWTNEMPGGKPLSKDPKVPPKTFLGGTPGRLQGLRCIPFVL